MVFERRHFFKGRKFKKMQPSYVIYMPEYFKGKNKDEIEKMLENREDEIEKFMQSDSKWEESQKAAYQFGVPIVILDRAKIAQKEQEKLENLVKKFEKNQDASIIPTLICEFENNRTGCRDYHEEIEKAFFSKKHLDDYVKRIETTIENLPTKSQRQDSYKLLKYAYTTEIRKREQFGKTEDDKIAKEWQNRLYEVNTREKNNNLHNVIEIEEVIDNIRKEQNSQITGLIDKKIIDEITDMKKKNLYNSTDAHSDRHIQDVMMFSYILGKQNGLNNDDLQLLIESAKFHDSGRIDDSKRLHAPESAKIAGEMLKDKYSENDLKIIKTAILYHEPREMITGKFDEKLYGKIADECGLDENYREKGKKICEILKDADSLDRTRFLNRAKLDNRYLHSDEARDLVNFATQVNVEYAKNDVELFCSNNEQYRDKVMNIHEENGGNYLQTIRDIKRGKMYEDEQVLDFVEGYKKNVSEVLSELEENYMGVDKSKIGVVKQEIVKMNEREKEEVIQKSQTERI